MFDCCQVWFLRAIFAVMYIYNKVSRLLIKQCHNCLYMLIFNLHLFYKARHIISVVDSAGQNITTEFVVFLYWFYKNDDYFNVNEFNEMFGYTLSNNLTIWTDLKYIEIKTINCKSGIADLVI